MKKSFITFCFLFFFVFCFCQSVAQDYGSKKNSGVVVIYSGSIRDAILVKSNKPKVRIKKIYLYSLLGNQVAEYSVRAFSLEIRLDDLRVGKYFMRYFLSDGTYGVVQIIKQ